MVYLTDGAVIYCTLTLTLFERRLFLEVDMRQQVGNCSRATGAKRKWSFEVVMVIRALCPKQSVGYYSIPRCCPCPDPRTPLTSVQTCWCLFLALRSTQPDPSEFQPSPRPSPRFSHIRTTQEHTCTHTCAHTHTASNRQWSKAVFEAEQEIRICVDKAPLPVPKLPTPSLIHSVGLNNFQITKQ